jgi:hypothetical protein
VSLSDYQPIAAQVYERIKGLRREAYDSSDYREGLNAFAEKRQPVFPGHPTHQSRGLPGGAERDDLGAAVGSATATALSAESALGANSGSHVARIVLTSGDDHARRAEFRLAAPRHAGCRKRRRRLGGSLLGGYS